MLCTNATKIPRPSPVRVIGDLRFTSISVGYWHACALTSDGVVYCWGDNQYGEAGVGDTLAVWSPKKVSGTTAFQSLGAQELAISTRVDITKFQDPTFVESFVKRYLIENASNNAAAPATTPDMTTLALQLGGMSV